MGEVLAEGGGSHLDGVPIATGLVTNRDHVVSGGRGLPPEGEGEGDKGRTRNEGEDERGEGKGERRDTVTRLGSQRR